MLYFSCRCSTCVGFTVNPFPQKTIYRPMNSVMYPPGEQCPPPPVEVTVAQHGSSLYRPVCPTLLPQNTPPTRTSSVTPEDVSWNNCALYSPITPNTPSHVSCQSNERRERRTGGGGELEGFFMQLIAHPGNKKSTAWVPGESRIMPSTLRASARSSKVWIP